MIACPMDVLEQFPIRKSKKQKAAFREAVCSYARSQGWSCREEKGSLGARNLVIGDPEQAKILVTAHYDTCAQLPFPNLIAPCSFWGFLATQLFQLLMIGLIFVLGRVVIGLLVDSSELASSLSLLVYWVVLLLVFIGPANRHNANDNTSGVVTLLETMKDVPLDSRSKVCFVLFDLEEAGLIGSDSYRKAHKTQVKHQVVLNLDCVGDGDDLVFIPGKKLRKNQKLMTWLDQYSRSYGAKRLWVKSEGFACYPSDQAQFPNGVGICALRRNKLGLYLSRIHTHRDTILEQTNVNILRACLISLISQRTAEDLFSKETRNETV